MVVIANPRRGRGRADAGLAGIERALRAAGLGYRIARTGGRGHATELARDALREGGRYLVAAGGDGTVHEVVNGMLDDDGRPVAADAVLGVLACGSGCDFVRSFGLPGGVTAAVRHLAGDAVRRIDVGRLTCTPGVTRYFANIAEAGLGGTVVARTAGLPGFLGGARYLCGFWLTLPGFRPATVRLEADGQAYQWRAHNVVVANGRFYGGGMQISPASEPDDGALDVLVMAGPKSDAFTILPRLYRGAHLPHRNIATLRAGRLRVDADPPFDIEADGEVLGATPATFEIIPGAIQLKI
ncbi:MAG: diacylglycerol kinase family protein [Streptosporangiaceae bacterium]|jgi:YegS/Rv2252/BmrU family lipid kinase